MSGFRDFFLVSHKTLQWMYQRSIGDYFVSHVVAIGILKMITPFVWIFFNLEEIMVKSKRSRRCQVRNICKLVEEIKAMRENIEDMFYLKEKRARFEDLSFKDSHNQKTAVKEHLDGNTYLKSFCEDTRTQVLARKG